MSNNVIILSITFESSANNNSTQIKVTGWKQLATYLSNKVKFYCNGEYLFITIGGTFTVSNNLLTNYSIDYSPKYMASGSYNNAIFVLNMDANKIEVHGATGNVQAYTSILVPI